MLSRARKRACGSTAKGDFVRIGRRPMADKTNFTIGGVISDRLEQATEISW